MLIVNNQISIPEDLLTESFIRAGGPGGQHVNKVSSAVQLRFRISDWDAPSPDVKTRLIRLAGRRYTEEGEIIIEARRFRHQEQNRLDARQRLVDLIARALVAPRPRTPTRPGKGAIEKRLDEKKKQQQVKSTRQKIRNFED